MKNAILCLVGLIVGWFIGANFSVSKVNENNQTQSIGAGEEVHSQAHVERIHELEQSLSVKEDELIAVQSEFEDYRLVAASRAQAQAEEEAAAEEEPVNPFMANVQAMAAESSKARKQEELEKLKQSLALTPEQLVTIEQFYAEEAERQATMMEKLFAGKSMEAIQAEATEAAVAQKYHSVGQLLKDILVPEQLEVYEINKEQEALERKEANAYHQLGTLQSDFLLDDDQKDTVFAVFYENDYALKPEDWKAHGIDHSDPEAHSKSQAIENERLLEELSDTLTPEQLERYRMKLENKDEMMRKSMQMFAPAQTGQ
jgi:hypothetical protein